MSAAAAPATKVLMRRMMMTSSSSMRLTRPASASLPSQSIRTFSTNPKMVENDTADSSFLSSSSHSSNISDSNPIFHTSRLRQPEGELFDESSRMQTKTQDLVGCSGHIRRVFGPQSNASVYLTCGGPELASHASFDPNYDQAKQWIRARPIGSSTISPVLIQGLVGTLVDAAFPQTVSMESSLRHARPLIVGTEVQATVTVLDVKPQHQPASLNYQNFNEEAGYEIDLKTSIRRVQDDALIAEGSHKVWIPNFTRL
mmetsp:Transcript_39242/g.94889  ORF Transcript_39242/g.94889 Transcript_39242/m.94889 type:complete len:257 (+) Transcript_39242:280-1050(+)